METIKNMCSNSANISTNTNKLSDQSAKHILNDLGLEDIPDIEQLLLETNATVESGYELLNKLKMNGFDKTDSETDFDTDIDTEQIINRVSKVKTSISN